MRIDDFGLDNTIWKDLNTNGFFGNQLGSNVAKTEMEVCLGLSYLFGLRYQEVQW